MNPEQQALIAANQRTMAFSVAQQKLPADASIADILAEAQKIVDWLQGRETNGAAQ